MGPMPAIHQRIQQGRGRNSKSIKDINGNLIKRVIRRDDREPIKWELYCKHDGSYWYLRQANTTEITEGFEYVMIERPDNDITREFYEPDESHEVIK